MKKIILIFAVTALLSSCKKDSLGCWTYIDCLGNDLNTVCNMSEGDVQSYCAAHSTAGCTMSYKRSY